MDFRVNRNQVIYIKQDNEYLLVTAKERVTLEVHKENKVKPKKRKNLDLNGVRDFGHEHKVLSSWHAFYSLLKLFH